MNEFIVPENRQLTYEQLTMGTMGISLEQLINDIRENRDGLYDSLFRYSETYHHKEDPT